MRRKHRILGLVELAAVAALTGCGGDGLDGEPVAATRETVSLACLEESTEFYNVPQRLKSASTHLCWVTKFTGRFNGSQTDETEDVGQGVMVGQDGYWWLQNNAAPTNDGQVEARCVRKSCFTGDGTDDVVWVSTHNISAIATANGTCATSKTYHGWWGDAATLLRWWPGPGDTNGSGENVQVLQSFDAFKSSGIQAADCRHDGLRGSIIGRANSLFVGTPDSGQLAQFTGSQFSVWGDNTLDLGVFADEAICYFTKVYGQFRGAGESVRLYQVAQGSRNVWFARSRQGADGASVKGSGQCFYYNQSNK